MNENLSKQNIWSRRKWQRLKAENYVSYLTHLSKDLTYLHRFHWWSQEKKMMEVFCGGWVLFVLEARFFQKFFPEQKTLNNTRDSVAIFLPPFEIVQWDVPVGAVEWTAYLSNQPLEDVFLRPTLFSWKREYQPTSLAEVQFILRSQSQVVDVGVGQNACRVAQKVKFYLSQNFRCEQSMKEVARSLSLSYSTMTHYFRRDYGLSPLEYRQKLRISEAGGQLASGRARAIDSCYDCGYTDYSNFKKKFKQTFGTTPTQFQNLERWDQKFESPQMIELS